MTHVELAKESDRTIKAQRKRIDGLAGIQYAGEAGCSADCKDAVIRFLQHGDHISLCRILSCSRDHALLLTINTGDLVAVKSGFASGYGGEGPRTFSYILELLDAHKVEIEEYEVKEALIERLDRSALTNLDLESLDEARSVRPARWPDYVEERHWRWRENKTLWEEFPPVISYAIVDPRLIELSLSFWDGRDEKLLSAYRRLEDIVRERTGLRDHGSKLFSRAFLGDKPRLGWTGLDDSERIGRGQLFTAIYNAHRNPRAHRELEELRDDQLCEFLLVNQLYRLEAQAVQMALSSED